MKTTCGPCERTWIISSMTGRAWGGWIIWIRLAGKNACGGPHLKMHAQAGPVQRRLLIEHVPYAVQPGCRLNEALSVCEPSWNLPARTPAVISLYLWEKPKMKTCLVQDASLPGPTHGICCFWTTERAEGLLFLPRNPLLRCDLHIWRMMV